MRNRSYYFTMLDGFIAIIILSVIAGVITVISKKHVVNEYFIYGMSGVGMYTGCAFLSFTVSIHIFSHLKVSENTGTILCCVFSLVVCPTVFTWYLLSQRFVATFDSKLTYFTFHIGAFVLAIMLLAIPVNIIEYVQSRNRITKP